MGAAWAKLKDSKALPSKSMEELMRTLAIVVLTLLAVSVGAESMATRTIDLDKPGAVIPAKSSRP